MNREEILRRISMLIGTKLPDDFAHKPGLWLESAYRLAAAGLLEVNGDKAIPVKTNDLALIGFHAEDSIRVFA